MATLEIVGGRPLTGDITISGAKNAALPAIFASLLSAESCVLKNIPPLRDINAAVAVVAEMGAQTKTGENEVCITAEKLSTHHAPHDWVKTMRASVLALGPLLARFGEAVVALPGGDAIGARPIDMHIAGLKKMGASIEVVRGNIRATAKKLRGAIIELPFPTVTGTENLMMAATLADGETIIKNAAREPEILDLADFLNKMGGKIKIDDGTIYICGAQKLRGATHAVIADRIETATYLCAVAAAGGDVILRQANAAHLTAVCDALQKSGAKLFIGDDDIRIIMQKRPLAVDVETAPYPAFATDVQAQWMAVNCIAEGDSMVTETIFENRFMHTAELARLGADIKLVRNTAMIRGVKKLQGAPVTATDIRASASLVIAALAARGATVIDRIYHLQRGYAKLDEKLKSIGAQITIRDE